MKLESILKSAGVFAAAAGIGALAYFTPLNGYADETANQGKKQELKFNENSDMKFGDNSDMGYDCIHFGFKTIKRTGSELPSSVAGFKQSDVKITQLYDDSGKKCVNKGSVDISKDGDVYAYKIVPENSLEYTITGLRYTNSNGEVIPIEFDGHKTANADLKVISASLASNPKKAEAVTLKITNLRNIKNFLIDVESVHGKKYPTETLELSGQ